MPIGPHWEIFAGDGPIVATALHAGHEVRPEVLSHMAVDEPTRHRDEDPYTDLWTPVGDHRVVVHRSRFELDLNRPRGGAIYGGPETAWGIDVWRSPLPDSERQVSLGHYDTFYGRVRGLLEDLLQRHDRVCVLDLHSYCHRREGPGEPPADPAGTPEINVCTAPLDRARWGPLLDRLDRDLARPLSSGRVFDVRENLSFDGTGGTFMQWVNGEFGDRICAVQVEVKKFFMDEWTGDLDLTAHAAVAEALATAVPGIRTSLR
jgi:N-formylglutamate deformylase